MQATTKIVKETQSAAEHYTTPNIDGFFLLPLKRFRNRRSTKTAALIPYFFHWRWFFSNS